MWEITWKQITTKKIKEVAMRELMLGYYVLQKACFKAKVLSEWTINE